MQNKLIFNKGTSSEMTLTGANIISVTLTEMFNSSDGITMGATCSNKLNADIIVPSGLALASSDVEAYAVDGSEEYPLGKFYVCDVETANDYKTASIECYDKFCKTEETYTPQINPVDETEEPGEPEEPGGPEEPAEPVEQEESNDEAEGGQGEGGETEEEEGESLTPKVWPKYSVKDIINEIADKLNLEVAFDVSAYEDLTVSHIEGYTYRQMLGYIAGISGKNACFDRAGKLDFKWYEKTGQTITRREQYQGQLNLAAGGEIQVLSLTSGTEEEVLSVGEGRGLSFENPFITQQQLSEILSGMENFSYHPCSVRFRGNMNIHAGDMISVEDEAGNLIDVCVMEQVLTFNGGMQAEIQCYGQSEESYSFQSSTTSGVVSKLSSRLEKTVKMSNEIKGSEGGYFQIIDLDGDGVSDTFVLRSGSGEGDLVFGNKNGIGFSRDGGKTLTTAINQYGICTEALHADELWGASLLIEGVSAGDMLRAVRNEATGEVYMEIGSGSNPVIFRVENDKIAFYNRGSEGAEAVSVCYIDPGSFVIKNLNRIQFGGLSIYPNDNGKILFSTGGNN